MTDRWLVQVFLKVPALCQTVPCGSLTRADSISRPEDETQQCASFSPGAVAAPLKLQFFSHLEAEELAKMKLL